jgi:hypothetical protein
MNVYIIIMQLVIWMKNLSSTNPSEIYRMNIRTLNTKSFKQDVYITKEHRR